MNSILSNSSQQYRHIDESAHLLFHEGDEVVTSVGGYRGRFPQPLVPEVVPFNPSWLNEQGLMVNVPGPAFLQSVTFKRSNANRAIGVYIKDRSEYNPGGMRSNGPHEQGEVILKFSISNRAVHQELPRERLAIIRPDGLVRIMGKDHRLMEIWRPYFTLIDPVQPSQGRQKVWCCETYGLPYSHRQDAEHVPATWGELFTSMTDLLEKLMCRMGYEDEIHGEDWKGDEDPLNWIFLLAQAESEDSDAAWTSMDTSLGAMLLWKELFKLKTHILDLSKADRYNRDHHEAWTTQLKRFVERAFELRDTAAPQT